MTIDVSRRGFFGLATKAAAVVVLAPVLTKLDLIGPDLWSDGIHDDWEGLQWLADEAYRTNKWFRLNGGLFRITKPLVVRSSVDLGYATLLPEGKRALDIPYVKDSPNMLHIAKLSIDSTRMPRDFDCLISSGFAPGALDKGCHGRRSRQRLESCLS